ncbi:MAG: hypothetical protein MMC33_000610 [Icmadophila ericetorum]|nr:hypothetical protein [Icmadophila ericetorum]
MVAAVAPSREEIVAAHRKRTWLTIGLLSRRNLSGFRARPSVLQLRSLVSLSGNDYYFAVVTEDFLSGAPFNLTASNWVPFLICPIVGPSNGTLSPDFEQQITQEWTEWYMGIQQNASTYERLDNENCIKAYSSKLLTNRFNLVLVSSDKNSTNSVLAFDRAEISSEGGQDLANWTCSQDPLVGSIVCDLTPILQNSASWEVSEHPIKYCLSEQTTGSCAVKFSFDLALVVIVCNVIKLCTELYLLFFGRLENVINCVGDAIASFITQEDVETRNMPLAGAKNIDTMLRYQPGQGPLQYIQRSSRWGTAAGRGRWIWSLLLLVVCLIFISVVLAVGIGFIGSKGFDISAAGIWNLGFGVVDPEILIASDNFGNPATLSLLANFPQLVLAVLYFLYNSILNSMFTAHDISEFAFKSQ